MNIKYKTYDGMQMSVFLHQSVCLLLFTLFSKCMHRGSQWFMLWKFKDLFDGIFTNLGIDMMYRHTIEGPNW